ncbi:hypothetical protein PsorP6_002145 [Peronosclerospora sorghi]|uniref:Uncharacterized protein n=1 Tax=Peronosclerospora sorghi TaxID=230839 RepID=A0ACC0WTP5_9STRA|nr:hypothetical protein PsorP6_002145 [Peronosclerospora sorghi]
MGCTFRKAAPFEAIPDNYNSVVIEKALGDFVVKLLHECPWSIPYTNHDNRYQKHKNKNQTPCLSSTFFRRPNRALD